MGAKGETVLNAEIITVGTELLLGDILNSNSQFLSKELAALGVSVLHQSTVGDNVDRLQTELRAAILRSDLIVITGGLGPTQDDLTRETVSDVLGIELVAHEESLNAIRAYFARTGNPMTANNEKQAMLPAGCTVFPNAFGTAPGCAVEHGGTIVVMLPGPPRELIPMFETHVAPYLAGFTDGVILSHNLHVFGIPESTISERCADLMAGENPTVAPYAKSGEVVLRVTARAADEEQAHALCQPAIDQIRDRLGDAVYLIGDGNLQQVVVSMLRQHGLKIATAESCTAGLLSGRLTEVPGVSDVFDCGIASYSNEIKHQVLGVPQEMLDQYGAISAETVSAMAIGARRVGNADLGVGISGVAGPDESEGKPVGTVYIALADEKRVWVKKITSGRLNDREQVRYLATSHALDLVRRYLLAIPTVMAGGLLIQPSADQPEPTVIERAPVDAKPTGMGGIWPWKGSRTAKWIKSIVWMLLLLGSFVAFMFTEWALPWWNNTALYQWLFPTRDVVTEGDYDWQIDQEDQEKPDAPEGMLEQFVTLYETNDDVRGWLTIPGTTIDTPVVQSIDETYYQTHDFNREESEIGTPYFSHDASFYSIYSNNRVLRITGSNVEEQQGFAELVQYADAAFLRDHPSMQMDTLFETARWEIFAVAVVQPDETEGAFDYTKHPHSDDDKFVTFISELQARSLFNVSVEPDITDQLLLLDTDLSVETGLDGVRLIIAAKKVWEPTTDITVEPNTRAILPDGYRGIAGVTDSGASTTTGTTTTAPSTTTTAPPTTTTTTTTTTAPTYLPLGSTEPPASPVKGVDTVSETERFADFRIYGKGKESGELPHSTRDEVCLALSKLVFHEIGYVNANIEAMKAQAVAAYTYVLFYVQTENQAYPVTFIKSFDPNGSATEQRVYAAVQAVLGEKLIDTSTGKLPYTPYYAASAGITANNHEVFGSSLAHLVSVDSSAETIEMCQKYIPTKTTTVQSQEQMAADTLTDKLTAYTGKPVYLDGDTFAVTAYGTGAGGVNRYVTKTNAYYFSGSTKKYLTGRQIRSALDLFSHAFTIQYNGNQVIITCYGHGHGVGLSQLGAMIYAGEYGWTYDQILAHYYSITTSSNVQLVTANGGI